MASVPVEKPAGWESEGQVEDWRMRLYQIAPEAGEAVVGDMVEGEEDAL